MHVFINDGNERCWLTDVHLKEGFCPHIGNQSKRQLKNDASIEPAIWCKVLILDSISIDCSRRVLRWCTGSSADGMFGVLQIIYILTIEAIKTITAVLLCRSIDKSSVGSVHVHWRKI